MASVYEDILNQLKNLNKRTSVLCCLGEPNGIATLGPDGKLDPDQMPSGGVPGSQGWNDTLLINNVATTGKPIYRLTGLNEYIDFIEPIDYGVLGGSRWSRWVDSNFVNPFSGRRDSVLGWLCYNSTTQGGVLDPSQAAAWYKMETYYEQSGVNMEFHMPEFQSADGVNQRIMSIYAKYTGGVNFINYNTFGTNYLSPNDVNQGWAALSTGYVGTVELQLNAQLGTGGLLGTMDNYCRIVMLDGFGTAGQIYQQGRGLWISGGQSISLEPSSGWVQLPTRLTFDNADFFSDGNVYLEAHSDAAGKGFLFFSSGENTLMMEILKDFIYCAVPLVTASYLDIVSTDPTYGQIIIPNVIVTDPTDTVYVKLWHDGNFLKTKASLVDTVQFDVGKSGLYSLPGASAQSTFTVTHGLNITTATYGVIVTPHNTLTTTQPHYVGNLTPTTFDVVFSAGLTGTVAFYWQISIL